MASAFITNYIARHQHRGNQLLHVIALPVTFFVPVYAMSIPDWTLAGGCFVGGYVLQFIGHAIEGNDAGEMILVKKLLGKPYREFGPNA